MKATLFYDPASPNNQHLGSLRSYDIDIEEERLAHGVAKTWRWIEVTNQEHLDRLLNNGAAVIAHGEIISIETPVETPEQTNTRRKDRAVALFLEIKRLEPIVNELSNVFDMSVEEERKMAAESELLDILNGVIPDAPRITAQGRLTTTKNANN